jgi:hypothetical protein
VNRRRAASLHGPDVNDRVPALRPGRVFVPAPADPTIAGGACFAVGDAGRACCTVAACTRTVGRDGACADGGLAFYCPAGSDGVLSLRSSTPDAGDPTLECCYF